MDIYNLIHLQVGYCRSNGEGYTWTLEAFDLCRSSPKVHTILSITQLHSYIIMDEDAFDLRTASLHLYIVLDECGLNKLTIRKRRDTYLFLEQLLNVYARLEVKELTLYHFGSQTEGATTPGLHSDLDTLFCLHDYNVIENWSDWQRGKPNMLMLQNRTAPGYCRLQLLMDDEPMAEKEVLNDEIFTCDGDGRVIVKNTWLNTPEPGEQHVRNGPAHSFPAGVGSIDRDFVGALHYNTWPTQAEEFIRRHRRHGWPSQNVLRKAVTHGVFLVPVGYKLSTTEHIEWRISASLTERCLMFSLNTVHIKCYVVLKMLVKTFVEPHARKCISSYHCKTAILYSVENTSPVFWRADNLLQCVTKCLTLLLTWVTDEICPHFVIAEENLFAGKVTAQNKKVLQSIFKDLITRSVRALLHVNIDDIGRKLQGKLFTTPSVMPVLDSFETMLLVAECEYNIHCLINTIIKGFIVNDKNTHLVAVIRSVYKNIVMCKRRIRDSEKHERQATNVFIENLSRWLGSMLASLALSHGMRVPRMAVQLLYIGVVYDVASMLKLASVFYSYGYFRKVEIILCKIEKHVISNTMQSICRCYAKSSGTVTDEFVQNLFFKRGSRARSKLYAHCVGFSPQELHCTPPALRTEFFRYIGDDLQDRDPDNDDWMDMAAVDCLPFLFYLQYMTYRQLRKRDLENHSLHNLYRCLREDHNFGHLETGWNLLGQCHELEQEPEVAMTCYITSLEIRPRNNAANWHVATLCYKVIQTHIMPFKCETERS